MSSYHLRIRLVESSCVPYSDAEATDKAQEPRCIAAIGVASATAAALRVPTWRSPAGRVSEPFTPSMGAGAFPVSEMTPT